MKKAEMEEHHGQYRALMASANRAESRGMVRQAVDTALAAWDHIDGMLQYERRYAEKEESDVDAVDLVLKYAPLLLDASLLNRVEALLAQVRRIERNASVDVAEQLAEARSRMWECHRLWSHVEGNPGTSQDQLRVVLGGDQGRWRWVAEAWERMGLIAREQEGRSYRLSLATRMGQIVSAKCPKCGDVAQGPKAMFLEPAKCPACHRDGHFVLLAKAS